jgi:hypothetical protein
MWQVKIPHEGWHFQMQGLRMSTIKDSGKNNNVKE